MKIQILRTILITLLLCTFFIIFGFSSQNGEESGGVSRKLTESLLGLSNIYNKMETEQKEQILHRTEQVIRKIAHFSIYTLVGILLMWFLCTYKSKDKWKVLITLLLGIIYATSDEIHQSFIPGRTPKVTDVYIDTLGICCGSILVLIGREMYYKYVTKLLQK